MKRLGTILTALLLAAALAPAATAAKRQRPDAVSATAEAAAPNAIQVFNDYVTPARTYSSERAVVHYVTLGVSAPPLNDDDADGVPDYVERVGAAADTALAYYERRGFASVIADAGGPDARPDIYISRFAAGYFGVAFPAADADGGGFLAVSNWLDPSPRPASAASTAPSPTNSSTSSSSPTSATSRRSKNGCSKAPPRRWRPGCSRRSRTSSRPCSSDSGSPAAAADHRAERRPAAALALPRRAAAAAAPGIPRRDRPSPGAPGGGAGGAVRAGHAPAVRPRVRRLRRLGGWQVRRPAPAPARAQPRAQRVGRPPAIDFVRLSPRTRSLTLRFTRGRGEAVLSYAVASPRAGEPRSSAAWPRGRSAGR